MKAMRRRIALPKHSVQNPRETPALFREAFGMRARPRAALGTVTMLREDE